MENFLQEKAGCGLKRSGNYSVPGTDLQLPLTVVNGSRPGPTLLVTAGIHGGEYPGIEACRLLSRQLEPTAVKGRVLLLPCVNLPAFYQRTAYVNPTDHKNLNRCFPGDPLGSETERIAAALVNDFFRTADCYLDLHSGDLPEQLQSFVFVPGLGAPKVLEQAQGAAACLDLPFGVRSRSKTGAYNYACLQGVPSLLIERGGHGEREPADIAGFQQDVLAVMRYFKLLAGNPPKPRPLPLLTEVSFMASPATGLWFPCYKIGEWVKAGHVLGQIEDFTGQVLHRCRAEHDGQLLYQCTSLPIVAGEALLAYGR